MKNYIREILQSFTSTEHSEKITDEVHSWLLDDNHAGEKDAALREIWKETKGEIDAGTWVSLAKVYQAIGVYKYNQSQSPLMKIWKYAVAAMITAVVSVSATLFFTQQHAATPGAMAESFTPAGEMENVTLPDGSVVQTNSETLLLYPEEFKGDTRTVYLIGEANFKIRKNPEKPFIVKSSTVSVTALGTEFNVSAYPECLDIVATLINGKVRVDCGEQASYILTPGQQITYKKSTKQSLLTDANLADATAWQKGQNVFRGKTMEEILLVLGRRFDIVFQYDASQFNNDKYNFHFRENSDIEEIMSIIREVVKGFDYRIDKNVCYINRK